MLYIVSGIMRSGTSMMMGCLGMGGLPMAYSLSRDRNFEKYADEHYHPNKDGFFELELAELLRPDFSEAYDGHAVKVVLGKLLELPPNNKKIIIMTRHREEIKQSYGAFFGDEAEKSIVNIFNVQEDAQKQVVKKFGSENVIFVPYREILSSPIEWLTKIKDCGFPINIDAASQNIKPHRCRFKHENLEVNI